MGWRSGEPRGMKTGGRNKGTPNKRTLELRDSLENLNFDVIQKLSRLMPKLTAEKQADVCLGLMAYLYPKRKAIDIPAERHPMSFADLAMKVDRTLKEEAEAQKNSDSSSQMD